MSSDLDSSQIRPLKKRSVSPRDDWDESDEEIPIYTTAPRRKLPVEVVEETQLIEHEDDIVMEDDFPIVEDEQIMESHDDIVDSEAWDSIPTPKPVPVLFRPLDVSPSNQLNRPSISTNSETPCRPRETNRRDSVSVSIRGKEGGQSNCDILIGAGEFGTPKSARWMRKTLSSEQFSGKTVIHVF